MTIVQHSLQLVIEVMRRIETLKHDSESQIERNWTAKFLRVLLEC